MQHNDSFILGSSPPVAPDAGHPWTPLRFLNLYRFLIAGFFVLVAERVLDVAPLGAYNPALFYWVALAYLAFSLVSAFTVHWRHPSFELQVHLQVIVDIVVVTLLMHASGGIASGLGMLMVISIAGGAMLLAGRAAGLFAALATVAVLLEQIGTHFANPAAAEQYSQAGLLGMTFFATAVLSHVLGWHIRHNERLAAQQAEALRRMAQLTEFVIERMQTGVVVADAEGQVHLMNDAARQLLGLSRVALARDLQALAPELARGWRAAAAGSPPPARPFRAPLSGAEIIPRFATLGDGRTGMVIFLEDTDAMAQQAQQLKLASLGRLTASIAHEIRNPLGAISHAAALLNEAPSLLTEDRRLIEIIEAHSRRMNVIVENVLQLGRRGQPQPTLMDVEPWLTQFRDEFLATVRVPAHAFEVRVHPPGLQVRVDPSHLHQILWNLCQNAARHSPRWRVEARLDARTGKPRIDVVDEGPGIPKDAAGHIFEPFFTTDRNGTGLGLYIARELAEYNRARLNYVPDAGGARFSLSFPDPRRQNEAA
ncbi:PAS domain-containing protein [Ectothiorhodospiraceae bacterium 2226]|nr:PAS domain-containing protein [Ectothiorhodospiraceae bacterium 2226]